MTTQPDPYQRPTAPEGAETAPSAPAEVAPQAAGWAETAPSAPAEVAPQAAGWAGSSPQDWAPGAEAPQPVAGAPRTLRPWLLAGVTGAVVGALVVGIMWAASSFVGDSGDDDAAAEDAAAACGVFERVPASWSRETVTEANTYQLGGAIALAQAAGRRDAAYRPLADQAQQVQQAVVTLNIERVEQLVVDVRNTCDEL